MKILATGKRGIVYKSGKTVIKMKKPESKAINRIANEAEWLQILNKHNIGPKFISFKEEKLKMEYIEGMEILTFAKHATKKEKQNILKQLLKQCRTLDKLQVNKQEMHHPTKHVLVRKKKVILIDFERCKKTQKPKNITQVCQFIARYFNCPEIQEKAKEYKETYSEKAYKDIEQCLTNIS